MSWPHIEAEENDIENLEIETKQVNALIDYNCGNIVHIKKYKVAGTGFVFADIEIIKDGLYTYEKKH